MEVRVAGIVVDEAAEVVTDAAADAVEPACWSGVDQQVGKISVSVDPADRVGEQSSDRLDVDRTTERGVDGHGAGDDQALDAG